MINETQLQQFAESFRGQLVQPGNAQYDEARTIFNAMIDKRPQLIAQCADVADVISAVNFGRDNHLETSIRGGGHNGPGLALVDDGLVIDLSRLNGIRVDPQARVAWVEGGCTWGDVDHATQGFGLSTVSGVISTTGVGGLTLGGGHGYLTRKYGLTIDNLVGADVVLANGSLVHANAEENADLFWAIRGGGGNFGVVTSFQFRLHPVSQVVAGPLFWSLEDMEKTLKWYRNWMPAATNDVYAFYLVAAVPPAAPFPEELQTKRVCGLQFCYTGDPEKADEVLDEIRSVAPPLFEFIGPMPYTALQGMFDALYGPGAYWYWKGDFMKDISDQAVDLYREFAEVPTIFSTMHLYPIDGAAHQVKDSDTVWSHRDANWSMVIAGVDPDPANTDTITHWARDFWEAIHPHSAGSAYVNFMMEEGDERIEATYGKAMDRLRTIKRKYDPDNFFHINQNIKPA